ncbi:MAG TPA: (2Fe-2S) ferredoxin domain-containing protein [Candidatus Avimonas sp.]|nr:(2Fe-2S) ferredoxin domain-containing protein [Clostridiales bacterium]HOB36799.1 (2Fe-2S) ferredoxin domain-containing protein [Candidatus Avimonas sp.]HQA15890.1 (2Fe-2S) ferredoxin domain-containing protein [Candidatus Avimonas sp.]HQD37989.1 (2Fe-2S) ferredoxin domain-containing protein [Candidatus Avimonas sp.]
MKTLAELQAIRDKARMQMKMRGDNREAVRVVVGMATCGISAGARPVLNAFVNEIEKRHLENVVVTQTGCIGMCQFEPIVEVMAPGKEKVTYAKVTADKVARIVAEHLVNGNPVMEYTIGNVMK